MLRSTSDVRAFQAHAPDADLDDLSARLAAARLPEAETVPAARRWDQGVPLADLVDLVHYWRTAYDWRSFEERLDRIGRFRTTIDGLGIHFLHRRSARADATPLILTHGWPGSIAEFVDVVDELADPEDTRAPAFHVVVPSLPGFGYSGKPATTGGEPRRSRPPGWNSWGGSATASSSRTAVTGEATSPRCSAAGSRHTFSASTPRSRKHRPV